MRRRTGRSSPLGRCLALAVGATAVHLPRVCVGGGRVVVVVQGGASLQRGRNVPREAAEEALLLLRVADGIGGGGFHLLRERSDTSSLRWSTFAFLSQSRRASDSEVVSDHRMTSRRRAYSGSTGMERTRLRQEPGSAAGAARCRSRRAALAFDSGMHIRTGATGSSTHYCLGGDGAEGEEETSALLQVWSSAEVDRRARDGRARPTFRRRDVEGLAANARELELPLVSMRERWMAMQSASSSSSDAWELDPSSSSFTRPSQSMGSGSLSES